MKYTESYRQRNLKGYLLTIAMNVCRNYLSRRGKEAKRSAAMPGEAPDWAKAAWAGTDTGRPRVGGQGNRIPKTVLRPFAHRF
ncbi:MAG: hypothetical protein HFH93_10865 [Lachnospiraceae bacterium]|nr:hypothetical protein [Lachnospiraceae bacterium]